MRGLTLCLLVALVAPGHVAFAGDAFGWEGPGWVLVRYEGPAGTLPGRATIVADVDGPAVAGIEFRNETIETWRRMVMLGGNTEVGVGPHVLRVLSEAPLDLGVSVGVQPNGTALLILWAAGVVESVEWSMETQAGASYEVLAASSETLFSLGDAPEEGVSARAAVHGVAASVAFASHRFDVEHQFFGYVGMRGDLLGHPLRENVELVRPDGERSVCPCQTPERGGAAWTAGAYRVERAGVGVEFGQPLVLAGVDVPRLPLTG